MEGFLNLIAGHFGGGFSYSLYRFSYLHLDPFGSSRHPNSKKRIAWDILAVLVSWVSKSPEKFRYNWTKHSFSGAFAVCFREGNISRKGSDFGMLMRFSLKWLKISSDYQVLQRDLGFSTHKSWPLKRAKKCPEFQGIKWSQWKKLWVFGGFVGDEISSPVMWGLFHKPMKFLDPGWLMESIRDPGFFSWFKWR